MAKAVAGVKRTKDAISKAAQQKKGGRKVIFNPLILHHS